MSADPATLAFYEASAEHDAARMIERGFTVDATDAAAAMVREASRRAGLRARQMRFDELDARDEYDAV